MSLLGDDFNEQLSPYMTEDLATYMQVIASMWDEVDLYVGFYDEELGWQNLLDPDTVPPGGLGYLAQYVGERLPAGLTEAAQREWINDQPNMIRGTLASIVFAAQRSLIGTRMVSVKERSGAAANPEDYLNVVTYTAETPNPSQVLEDLYTVVPADIQLTYQVQAGQSWNSLSGTWAGVASTYAKWLDVAGALAGYITIERPRPI